MACRAPTGSQYDPVERRTCAVTPRNVPVCGCVPRNDPLVKPAVPGLGVATLCERAVGFVGPGDDELGCAGLPGVDPEELDGFTRPLVTDIWTVEPDCILAAQLHGLRDGLSEVRELVAPTVLIIEGPVHNHPCCACSTVFSMLRPSVRRWPRTGPQPLRRCLLCNRRFAVPPRLRWRV